MPVSDLNYFVTIAPSINADHKLTISRISKIDLDSLTTDPKVLDVLQVLKNKGQLLLNKPLSTIRSRTIFRAVPLPQQKLVYRQTRSEGFDGFYHAIDLVSKLHRTKKLVNQGKAQEARENERTKYGQVASVPTHFKWNFSWTEIKHPSLEGMLKSPNITINYKHLLKEQKEELVDHLAAELFFYFRKGIPCYYMNKVLDKLIMDFPCFNDQSTCLGFVSILNHVTIK